MKRRRHQRNDLKNEDNKDKLSNLPDCVFLHILSFLKTRQAVQICLLFRSWKYLWKHLPTLTLCSYDFKTLKGFTKFVTQILSHRDSSTVLKALDIDRHGMMEPHILKRIVKYVVSHNVNHIRLSCDIEHFSLSVFSCPSLTSLDLLFISSQIFPNSLNLPALTFLKLHYFSFCGGTGGRVEPFSTFNKLNTLILFHCRVPDAQAPPLLCISSTTLLNLSCCSSQLHLKIELSAPNLSIFAFSGIPFLKLSGSHLSSIKQVSIDIYDNYHLEANLGLLNGLLEMTNIESLTVSPRTLQSLSLIPGILKLKLPSFLNLKSLQLNLRCDSFRFSTMMRRDINMELAGGKSWKENAKLRQIIKGGLEPIFSSIFDRMVDFLLQNSPSAKVDKVEFSPK